MASKSYALEHALDWKRCSRLVWRRKQHRDQPAALLRFKHDEPECKSRHAGRGSRNAEDHNQRRGDGHQLPGYGCCNQHRDKCQKTRSNDTPDEAPTRVV